MRASWPERTKSSDLFTRQSRSPKRDSIMAYQRRQCPRIYMGVHHRTNRRVSAILSTLYGIVSNVPIIGAGQASAYRKPWRRGSSCAQSSSSAPSHGPRRRLQCVDRPSRSSWGGLERLHSCGLARRVPCRHSLLRHAKTPCCLGLQD
jgi:hypothetical protein